MSKIKPSKLIFLIFVTFGTLLFFFQIFSKQQTNFQKNTDKHQIIVSILPQKQIVERIAGNNFAANELIPPGFSPETYDPTTQEMKIVAQAQIYFRIGKITFEKTNLEKLEEVNPSMLVVDTSVNNDFINIDEHTHEGEGKQDLNEIPEEIDPHIWLAPRMVKKQAEIIYSSLVATYPEYTDEFSKNYKQLQDDLDQLDQELQIAFKPIQGKTMLVYHPAFGYLARDYGFTQEFIEIEGKEPSISDIKNIINQAKNEDIRVIFVQKQFSSDSARAIADNINGVVVEIDPLDADYFGNMKAMAQTISNVLK